MYIPTYDVVTASRPHDEPTGGWSSLIGIITAICGNILISFALNTQRYAHMRLEKDQDDANEKSRAERAQQRELDANDERQLRVAEERARKNAEDAARSRGNAGERQPLIPKVGSRKSSASSSDTYVEEDKEEPAKSYLKSPIWWLGISLMVVGEAGNFLAYGFAPASIVSPLGVVALISNCLIAPLLLHEEFRIRDGVGVIIAVAGCVTVVLSASGSNPKLDPDDILSLITEWEFETYLGVTGVLIVILMFASNKFGERTVLIDLGLVGLFGGYTALSTKGVASLLSNTIWRAFTFPITYVLVVVLVATAVLQIKYVNRALQRFNSTIVIPTQFVLFTISVIVGSAVLYRDFERQSAADAGKFVGGCALTFLGVWFITSGRSDNGEDDDIEEDRVNLVDHDQVGVQKRSPVKRSHSEVMPPALVVSDDSGTLDQTLTAAGPAMRAAVRPSPTTISRRPSDPRKMPALHATTSEPVITTLDTSAHTLQPQTPLRGQPSPTIEGNRLLGRHSIVDLLPGPLMSPLSSSLSAIVADSLRRGVEQSPLSSIRSKSFRLPRRRTGDGRTKPRRPSTESVEDNVDEQSEPPETPQSTTGRDRSFSATIGDIFKRQKSHGPSEA